MKKIYLALLVLITSSCNTNLLLCSDQAARANHHTSSRIAHVEDDESDDEFMQAYINRTQPSEMLRVNHTQQSRLTTTDHVLKIETESGSYIITCQTRSLRSVQFNHEETHVTAIEASEVIENHLTQTVSPLVAGLGIGIAIASCTIS